jgi:hypothetical protein
MASLLGRFEEKGSKVYASELIPLVWTKPCVYWNFVGNFDNCSGAPVVVAMTAEMLGCREAHCIPILSHEPGDD